MGWSGSQFMVSCKYIYMSDNTSGYIMSLYSEKNPHVCDICDIWFIIIRKKYGSDISLLFL